MAGDHLWSPTSVSVDFCYVGDSDCVVSDGRLINPFVIEAVGGQEDRGRYHVIVQSFLVDTDFLCLVCTNQFPGD